MSRVPATRASYQSHCAVPVPLLTYHSIMRYAGEACPRVKIAAALCLALVARTAPLCAQTVAGVVTDSSGAGIAGAEISLVGVDMRVRTDEAGRFRLSAPPGLVTISARRLGFLPETRQVTLKESQ